MKKQKPWLDLNGKQLDDEALKIASKSWSKETWDSYLESLEWNPKLEVLTRNAQLLEEITANPSVEMPAISDLLSEMVRGFIQALPDRQRHVIEEEFYMRRGQRSIAEGLGVSRALVRKIRKAALSTLSLKINSLQMARGSAHFRLIDERTSFLSS